MNVSHLIMWAVIVRSTRSEWINWLTIDRTRSGAWNKYRDQFLDGNDAEKERRKKRVRLARVRVEEQAQ